MDISVYNNKRYLISILVNCFWGIFALGVVANSHIIQIVPVVA